MRLLAGWLAVTLGGCGDGSVPSPFDPPGAAGAGAGGEPAGGAAGSPGTSAPDPLPPAGGGGLPQTLGAPCLEDEQCDDQLDCTRDRCDHHVGRCRHEPEHSRCADQVYCNGVEVCEPRVGCSGGEPVTCADENPCTIDRCDEATRTCEHLARDADSDGDPDLACANGGDCNDSNPFVSSLEPEVCDNARDDDCDAEIDEAQCELPRHDTCVDPLEIRAARSFELQLSAAHSDYSASCAGGGELWRDVVAAVVVEEGPINVDLLATASTGQLALAGATECGDLSSELGCSEPADSPAGEAVSRLLLRELPAGSYPVYLFHQSASAAVLRADFVAAEPKPSNETCGTAVPLSPGVPMVVSVCDADQDLTSRCDAATGELVFSFSLGVPQDVTAYSVSLDGYGQPSLSLRQSPCSDESSELVCHSADPALLFYRALPAGAYYLAVSASAPTDLQVVLETESPTEALLDEQCDGAPPLQPNTMIDVPLAHHVDDVHTECLAGAADAVYALELSEISDVRAVARLSSEDTGAVALVQAPCAGPEDVISCSDSNRSPTRTSARQLSPGSYRVVVESAFASPTQLMALVRPARDPVLVAFASTCPEALEIPPGGGLFEGNTANATADYKAGCDSGGGEPGGGAPEQVLRLRLPERKRVIFDMQGSEYDTLLNVRRGPDCPGSELSRACAAGYIADRSYLDLVLEAGEYLVQVDGYAGDAGRWFLDVFVVDPSPVGVSGSADGYGQ